MRIRSFLAAAILFTPFFAAGQSAVSIAGAWEGESICTVRDSPCHDEHVVYEIGTDKTAEDNPDRLGPRREWKIDAYKIVNSEKQFMGTLPCSYNQKTRNLSCLAKTRVESDWEFFFEGNLLRGTLHLLPEKTLFRNVTAKRVSSK